ncbi:uncharacterized protein [Pithys albifrons albifrons]|uniref:uncharacterized protein isoform X3 n=1 Tax=Pithys albifrons albifrons TaxID=3385563 RepID=UPI003A5CCE1E
MEFLQLHLCCAGRHSPQPIPAGQRLHIPGHPGCLHATGHPGLLPRYRRPPRCRVPRAASGAPAAPVVPITRCRLPPCHRRLPRYRLPLQSWPPSCCHDVLGTPGCLHGIACHCNTSQSYGSGDRGLFHGTGCSYSTGCFHGTGCSHGPAASMVSATPARLAAHSRLPARSGELRPSARMPRLLQGRSVARVLRRAPTICPLPATVTPRPLQPPAHSRPPAHSGELRPSARHATAAPRPRGCA